jgi:hypothetical protein
MLVKIPDRSDQAFWVDLSRLLDYFVRLFRCIPRVSWLGAPLGFRFVCLIYFHALPPKVVGDMVYMGAVVNRPICHSLKSWDTDIGAFGAAQIEMTTRLPSSGCSRSKHTVLCGK